MDAEPTGDEARAIDKAKVAEVAAAFAESGHYPPKPMGGLFLILTPTRKTKKYDDGRTTSVHLVKQDVATGL